MKTKSQKVFMVVLMVCAVVCIAVYLYVYNNFNEKTEALNSSNEALSAKVSELEILYSQIESNRQQIETMTAEIKQMLDTFPADVKEEDAIYLTMRTWQEGVPANFGGISIGEREPFASIPVEVVQAGGIEELSEEITFIQRNVTYNNTASYDGMKQLLTSIMDNPEKVTLTSVTYAAKEGSEEEKSSSFQLDGTIDVTFYAVTGTGKEYVPRDFKDFSLGIDNLFGNAKTR